jgi:hypothetical protein
MSGSSEYNRDFFDANANITYIGSGSLGGKASSLIAMNQKVTRHFEQDPVMDISVDIPRMTVITTEHFDAFMQLNHLYDVALSDIPDERIAHAFQRASLPPKLVGDLRSIAHQVCVPLAVRSSSLLEDALQHPFAGVYGTKMIPNHQHSADARFGQLSDAIKFVYASTFFADAKNYINSVGKDLTAEKMAVIIQEIVGQRFGERFYPHISGVARSYNFYPSGRSKPEHGVVALALGLGKTIVDGGSSWNYSPAYPKAPAPYYDLSDMLKNTQTKFWAVNMGKTPSYDPMRETEYLVEATLQDAEYDNTLRFIASTYNPQSDRVVPGTGSDGPRIIDFAPLLVLEDIPMNKAIRRLLALCEDTTHSKVEIEFAVTLDRKNCAPARLGFLQMRPMAAAEGQIDLPPERLEADDVLAASIQALGHGVREDIRDIVYTRFDSFDVAKTPDIALELSKINAELLSLKRPYLLIGFGRWGTSDPWRGIPIVWSQISAARAIVEVERHGMETDLSQGSHFFHNMTSFQVSYLCMPLRHQYQINWDWLLQHPPLTETKYLRHIRLAQPLLIKVDGKSGRGAIFHT